MHEKLLTNFTKEMTEKELIEVQITNQPLEGHSERLLKDSVSTIV